jgi:hypothetical protein
MTTINSSCNACDDLRGASHIPLKITRVVTPPALFKITRVANNVMGWSRPRRVTNSFYRMMMHLCKESLKTGHWHSWFESQLHFSYSASPVFDYVHVIFRRTLTACFPLGTVENT